MHKLEIRHIEGFENPRFEVIRAKNGRSAGQVTLPDPALHPVKGCPDSNLIKELSWYLEEFLTYPFEPWTDRAENLREAVEDWGKQAFNALFSGGAGRDFYRDAVRNGVDNLILKITADNPRVLSWPWEALKDPDRGFLALDCKMERRINKAPDPVPPSEELPKDRVKILLVTARPKINDVSYRSISRPLVELVEEKKLPAEITVLRPPTFKALCAHLDDNPNTYHILHFDGHGGYGEAGEGEDYRHKLKGTPTGVLLFEDEDGKEDKVTAKTLAQLLRAHNIPAAVLNACQSAKVDERAEDAFASVAAALVKAGIGNVTAMAHSLYVSGARVFLPDFYDTLFRTGSMAGAALSGRRAMYGDMGRVCARGLFPLEDWLVPVIFQQEEFDFSFAKTKKAEAKGGGPSVPEEAAYAAPVHGLVGRDGPMLELERALRRKPAGILIHGMGGTGKTTLAHGFVKWLSQTGGLGNGCFWFNFLEIRSAEFMFNSIGGPLFGPGFLSENVENKAAILVKVLKEHPFLLVWDNFESAKGTAGDWDTARLSKDDFDLLAAFLKALRGGKTKVIITSRSAEEWLGTENRFKLELGGLTGEERWEYCGLILDDLGLKPDRDDPALSDLMDLLNGHPLLMRAVVPKLAEMKPAAISTALKENPGGLNLEEGEIKEKIEATLGFVTRSLPEELKPLLIPLALHERFVDADMIEYMAKEAGAGINRPEIDRFAALLADAGLIGDVAKKSLFQLHPALTGFLRSKALPEADEGERAAWTKAFTAIMAIFAHQLTPQPLHVQRFPFHCHGPNFHSALAEAKKLGDFAVTFALIQALAQFALLTRDMEGAERLYGDLATLAHDAGEEKHEAGALHQLGMVAEERRDFARAEELYQKSLEIKEKLGDRADAATTYHQLGIVAHKRREWDKAGEWCLKAVAIFEGLGLEHMAASGYHQLGMVAEGKGDWDSAEEWYMKAVAIREKLGIEGLLATDYHHLGIVAQEKGDWDKAVEWYLKSLKIKEKLGDVTGAAITLHQLGMVAQKRGALDSAEGYYLQALAIKEKLGDVNGAATTYFQLGALEGTRGRLRASGKWFLKAMKAFHATSDGYNVQKAARNFFVTLSLSEEKERDSLKSLWQGELGPFPEEAYQAFLAAEAEPAPAS